jgi:hypothetical protein
MFLRKRAGVIAKRTNNALQNANINNLKTRLLLTERPIRKRENLDTTSFLLRQCGVDHQKDAARKVRTPKKLIHRLLSVVLSALSLK